MEHIIEYGAYMPHGMCLLWQPWLVLLWAGSDLLIFLSYTAIPLALISVLRQRDEMPHRGLIALFAAFILLCGLTHLFGIVTLWYPIYPIVGWVKLATGLVSMTTAIVLFRLVPTLIALPSPRALEDVNARLREEIAAHKATLASLEKQVEERTRELKSANQMLAVQTREAVHRSGNLLAVVSSLANQSARGKDRTEDFLATFLGRIRALADATRAISRDERASTGLRRVVENRLAPLIEMYGERVSCEGPDLKVNSEAAQQLSLALHELATNTQKYGLAVSQDTRVEVLWSADDEGFELVWREDALSIAQGQPAQEEGFGTKLLTRVIPTMLKGEASRELGENRLIYRLTAPIEAVAASEDSSETRALAARIVDESFGLDQERT
ncbi:sensor histidine kinase [Aurantiacibacter hainanensis]|uniref:sensor histidine kinase n=1 Tax=Aurantiacibacter hainanensis TaxID=3076114 RepID=UPI0030C67F4F